MMMITMIMMMIVMINDRHDDYDDQVSEGLYSDSTRGIYLLCLILQVKINILIDPDDDCDDHDDDCDDQ